MTAKRLSKEEAAEIWAINKVVPGLKWGLCRVCQTYCATNWDTWGNKHPLCEDVQVPVKRVNRKIPDPNQLTMG